MSYFSRRTRRTIKPIFFYILTFWFGIAPLTFAQEVPMQYDMDEHSHSDLELGFSVGYARLEEEKEDALNLHLHIMKRLSDHGIQQYISVGAGIETILSTENHVGAMLSLAIHPTERLVISFSQGLEWANHEGDWESNLASHIEASYLFEATDFHYGPVIGYSKASDKQHYTIGLHFGVPLY